MLQRKSVEMHRANFAASVVTINGQTVIRVVDLYTDACPSMTVTNDAENVVAHVVGHLGCHRIFYQDTDGQWDELVHQDGVFSTFAPLPDDIRVQL